MLSIVVLCFCVASTIADPFYGEYGPGLALHPLFHHAYGVAAPLPVAAPAPIALDTKNQYHYQDGFGFGAHGHSEPTGYHHATHDPHGNKQGEFSYLKADGTIHKTRYVADSLGYRVESNDLPVGHTLRKRSIAYQYGHTPIVTPSGYLADTPEVSAAKAAHFAEHAKRGNYHLTGATPIAPAVSHYSAWPTPTPVAAWSTPVNSWSPLVRSGLPTVTPHKIWDEGSYVSPYHSSYGGAAVVPEGPVTDTPEVVAAKSAHFAEHAAVLARSGGAVTGHVGHVQPYYTPAAYSAGEPVDTPEVMQAKAAHFAEYARIASRQKRSIPFGTYPASTSPLLEDFRVIPSHPVVLPHHPLTPPPHSWYGSHLIHSPLAPSYLLTK